jgi:hypothetical protein
MSEAQRPEIKAENDKAEVVTGSEAKNKSKNTGRGEKKSKKEKKNEKVIYMRVEEDDDPIYVKIKRLILKLTDQYVMTYKKPIRRKKLKELVFTNDEKLAKLYEEEKEVAVGIFNYALISLVREDKILKVKDPEKERYSYYMLPKHIDMFKDEIIGVKEPAGQGKSNGGQRT